MLSLYIHIPYCVRKCLYCGFYSTVYAPQEADGFISALELEAQSVPTSLTKRRISSIYLGGGTPTVLSLHQIDRVMHIIKRTFLFADNVEFTVEANPHTAKSSCLKALLGHSVNRLSLGVQSFSDSVLLALGRPHNAKQATDTFNRARSLGYKNIGIDLIFGLPGQTRAEWEKTIDAAVLLNADHISAYSLSLEGGSHFMRQAEAGRLRLPDDETVAGMYELAVSTLSGAGYHRYECSNFCRPGFECRHNQNYWARGEYLGLGPAASSFLEGQRYDNIADASEYTRLLSSGLSAVVTEETIGKDAAARETILLGIRTTRGVNLDRYAQEYGSGIFHRLEKKIGLLEAAGLLFISEGWLRLTDRGFLLSDEVVTRLVA
jgi:oxygen-independent coproporphyrinogen III oxidase